MNATQVDGIKRHIIFIVTIVMSLAAGLSGAHAAWVENLPTQVTNPDGTALDILITGDEYFNYLHDNQGFTIIKGEDGFYYYAWKPNFEVEASPFRAALFNPSEAGLTPHIGISPDDYLQRKKTILAKAETLSSGSVHQGALNNIVIYIRFSDDAEFDRPISHFDSIMNHSTAPSLKTYFREVSYEKLTISSHHFPHADGSTTLSFQDFYPRAYFQPYHASTNPNGYKTDSERTSREHFLLTRAIAHVEPRFRPIWN